jgi:glycosyltransferase involved in cell wall biosynthesis
MRYSDVTKTRVLRIIARMNVGGPAVQISGLMRGLDLELFDQRLITGFCDDDEADYLETQAQDVSVTRIPGLGRALNLRDDSKAIPGLIRQISHFKPDIIHTHTAKAGVLGRIAAKSSFSQAKLVHTYHGHLLHGYFSPRKTQLVRGLESFLARGTDRLVAVGPQVRDDLLAAEIGHAEQYVIIPPGLRPAVIPERIEARLALGLPPQGPVVSFIGRLTGIKRVDRFADAVAIVAKMNPEIRFLVAGSGDQESALADQVERQNLAVTLLGWRSDIETILGASDLLVLTSDNEGTPLSLIQAALAGIPVVATNVGSVKDVVLDGTTGILCSKDPSQIAEAILKLVNDPALSQQMGTSAKEIAKARFGVSRLVNDHQDLYHDLMKA